MVLDSTRNKSSFGKLKYISLSLKLSLIIGFDHVMILIISTQNRVGIKPNQDITK